VTPLRGTKRSDIYGKLSPRFIGPYQILSRIGKFSYKLELQEGLVVVHPVFHVSQLRKRLRLEEAVGLYNTLEYLEHHVRILDKAIKKTKSKIIPLCKVLWHHHTEDECRMSTHTCSLSECAQSQGRESCKGWTVTTHRFASNEKPNFLIFFLKHR
jgi:hypothetical protein